MPPEAQLDPVANTLDLRQPFTAGAGETRPRGAAVAGVEIADLGYFDNLLHDDPAIRAQKHRHLRKVFDAAALLGVDAVCGFVGRNLQREPGPEPRALRGAGDSAAARRAQIAG